jgi:hypothetical protein
VIAREPATEQLDIEATNLLAHMLLTTVRAHLEMRPPGNDTVLEICNALGATAASVIAGTGPDPRVLEFFNRALADHLKLYAENDAPQPGEGEEQP